MNVALVEGRVYRHTCFERFEEKHLETNGVNNLEKESRTSVINVNKDKGKLGSCE